MIENGLSGVFIHYIESLSRELCCPATYLLMVKPEAHANLYRRTLANLASILKSFWALRCLQMSSIPNGNVKREHSGCCTVV